MYNLNNVMFPECGMFLSFDITSLLKMDCINLSSGRFVMINSIFWFYYVNVIVTRYTIYLKMGSIEILMV